MIERSLESHQRAFNADRAARQLMLGAHTAPEIKHAGCKENSPLRHRAVAGDAQAVPAARPRGLTRTLLQGAADRRRLLLAVGGGAGPGQRRSAGRAKLATIAYLRAYLPTRLARIEEGGEIPPVPATEAWGTLDPANEA